MGTLLHFCAIALASALSITKDNVRGIQKGMLFNFYIFSCTGKCLYYKEWNRPQNTMEDPEEERKLVFGMLFSLKDLASKLSPSEGSEGLHIIKTNSFTLHHYQSVTGLVFVLNTGNDIPDQYQTLKHVYTNIYIEYVLRNPLYMFSIDSPIDSPLFEKKVDEYLRSGRGALPGSV